MPLTYCMLPYTVYVYYTPVLTAYSLPVPLQTCVDTLLISSMPIYISELALPIEDTVQHQTCTKHAAGHCTLYIGYCV